MYSCFGHCSSMARVYRCHKTPGKVSDLHGISFMLTFYKCLYTAYFEAHSDFAP